MSSMIPEREQQNHCRQAKSHWNGRKHHVVLRERFHMQLYQAETSTVLKSEDAAIATVICEGGVRAHATGFGGGMVMLLHDRNKNETLVISAYSAAPRTATEETFVTNPALAEIGCSAYKLTITEGEIFRDLYHAAFLRRLAIARDPVELFYRGEIANQIVLEMKQRGGLLTKVDLASYETNIEKPIEVRLSNGYTLRGPQPPSSFTALSLLVDTMMSRFWSESNITMDASYLRELLKAQQLALSRLEELGDLEYMLNDPVTQVLQAPQNSTSYDASHEEKIADIRNLMWNLKDQGSVGSHINVMDGGGLAVALSSSLNERFGSVRRSVKGGFVWNNEMSSFTIPDKEKSEDIHVNAVEGRKRPRSSMMPLMVFDEAGQVKLTFSNKMCFNVTSQVIENLCYEGERPFRASVETMSPLPLRTRRSQCDSEMPLRYHQVSVERMICIGPRYLSLG
ncbi:unnamed protein product [Haemonchus placei]|uniref:Anaphase-promoting complex subunit 1 n=1 Tax=Haemonchus placei TaxID=6290 RepID=A0A0N4W6D9_HAEPC|nr:unnamed protein product [Haemonchus placei]